MRHLITAIATLSIGTFPLAAQNPARPVTPPPQRQVGALPLTAEQRERQQAIREKYTRELQAQREAIQATNEKMRAEIAGVLTPEQRARMRQAARRGGAPGDVMGLPPQDDIYARPGGMMRNRAEAMMRTRSYRGGRTIIIRVPRSALRNRQAMRRRVGRRMMQPGAPPRQQRGGMPGQGARKAPGGG